MAIYLDDIVEIIDKLSLKIDLIIYHELGINYRFDGDKLRFTDTFLKIYANKYLGFEKLFGKLNFKATPNKDFYDKLKKLNC